MTENNNPLVSIVIPVYNGDNFLREAIDSALAQTYKNCEIIVINDGSTDGTENICRSYGDRIRYFCKENGGVATALNLGIENMRGEYFSWLSHDDIYFPRKIEAQIEALKKDSDMTKPVFGDYELLYQTTGKRVPYILNELDDENRLTRPMYPVIKGRVNGCTVLIHRSHFERVGTFNRTLRCVQDYDLWFRLFGNKKSIYVNEPMCVNRQHDKQGTVTIPTFNKEVIEMHKEYLRKLTDREVEEIYDSKFLFLFHIWTLIRLRDGDDSEIYEKLCEERDRYRIPDRLKDLLRDALGGRICPVCIFGSGQWGMILFWLLELCGLRVHCFIDNDVKKHDTEVTKGVPCRSLASLTNQKNELLIMVGIQMGKAVVDQLRGEGFPYVLTKRQIDAGLGAASRASVLRQ